MDLLRHRAYARAGLMGNPSDGYHGKTLSVIVRNYFAEVVLYEWEDVEIVLAQEDRVRFRVGQRIGSRRRSARLLRRHSAGEGEYQDSLWSIAADAIGCTTAISRFAIRPIFRERWDWPVRAPSSWRRCGP